ncbi:ELM1/GtrOC1 family putative glycosyltransferase [Methylobrevis albus]|uniref:Mitochondrial fission ELM1 family protein n=1 Tax=Methylobrevis albus TaxID=2793297 RepID=A0A931HYC2_9HYPH|nr:ELM1/GtrOC1 family putative glycosyltransferase [Methylobrevis albus]MBH0236355.1 mitochondrial fission ELM1 family protein [Methylobrevis albus]
MRLLVLEDKKPGHAHQARGIARAIARLTAVETTQIEARPGRLGHHRLLAFAANRRGGKAATWLRRLYGIDVAVLGRPDAVVGSGRPTIAAGLFLSRHFGVPFVYAGRIKGYHLDDRCLQLVASPRHGFDPGCAYAPVPGLIDPAALPTPRRLDDPAALNGALATLFVGGDGPAHLFFEKDWAALGALLREARERLGLRWQASTSRRTPAIAADRLAALAAEGVIERFVDYRSAGAGSADDLFGADVLVVTEDSLSMLAEAVAARRPVVALRPAMTRDNFANEVVAAMAGRGELAVVPLGAVTPERLGAAILSCRPFEEDPRDRIAAAVAPILGLDQPKRTSSTS